MALIESCPGAEARRRSRRRGSKKGWTSLYILAIVFACLLIPVVGTFVYQVVTDPVTPHIMMELYYRLVDTFAKPSKAELKRRRRDAKAMARAAAKVERDRRRRLAVESGLLPDESGRGDGVERAPKLRSSDGDLEDRRKSRSRRRRQGPPDDSIEEVDGDSRFALPARVGGGGDYYKYGEGGVGTTPAMQVN